MKTLTLLALLLAGCSACSSSDEELERVPSRECDGTSLRHICGSTPGASTMQYGVSLSCSTTPWLPHGAGQDWRPEGQSGCIDIVVSVGAGTNARCCP